MYRGALGREAVLVRVRREGRDTRDRKVEGGNRVPAGHDTSILLQLLDTTHPFYCRCFFNIHVQALTLHHSGWLSLLKLSRWFRGTNPSTLARERARGKHIGETPFT